MDIINLNHAESKRILDKCRALMVEKNITLVTPHADHTRSPSVVDVMYAHQFFARPTVSENDSSNLVLHLTKKRTPPTEFTFVDVFTKE